MRGLVALSIALSTLTLAGPVVLSGPRVAEAAGCQQCVRKLGVSMCKPVAGEGFSKCNVKTNGDCDLSGYCSDGKGDDGDEPWPWYF
ncbi:MAG: hypothetical protein HYV63_31945 [Candidatus Schekmanbacteria bacterium]|nr:hypothetical protein [Candidatus Schekmanbacteria bacterium]